MILAAHQPAYLPWLGYFDRIARADMFIYLDRVQFEKNSFINRNRIKTSQGALWLTVPIKTKGHLSNTMVDTVIDESQPWRSKHLKAISLNYNKAKYFSNSYQKINTLIQNMETNLSELLWQQLQFWLNEFKITTRVIRLSELPDMGSKNVLVLNLCRHFGADHYLSGALGRNYLDENDFRMAGITVEYQSYKNPVYSQLWGEFIPNLSIVDSYLNCDPHFFKFE